MRGIVLTAAAVALAAMPQSGVSLSVINNGQVVTTLDVDVTQRDPVNSKS